MHIRIVQLQQQQLIIQTIDKEYSELNLPGRNSPVLNLFNFSFFIFILFQFIFLQNWSGNWHLPHQGWLPAGRRAQSLTASL